MDSLLPLIKNPVNLKIKVKEFASQSPNLESSNSLSGTGSVDENLIATSATSSKSGEVTDSLSNLPSLSQVTTKAETSGAKEIKACFCCFWVFPQSFRGEEKNIHIDRCMEGLGEKDKRLWSRCQGDLKQYR